MSEIETENVVAKYDPTAENPGMIAMRIARAATRATRTVMADSMRIGAQAISDARSGKPRYEVALNAGNGARRAGSDVMEIAKEFAVPGASAVQSAVRAAGGAARPATELAAGSAATVGSTVSTFANMSRSDIRADLRKRGAELLRRSTALDDPDEHPAFRHILSSLAPDEARVIRYLANSGPNPLIDVVEIDAVRRSGREICHNVSLVGSEAGCIRPALAPVYIDNLSRLGVVAVTDYPVTSEADYELLLAQPAIDGLPRPKGFFTRRKMKYKGVRLSEFGQSLYEVCFKHVDVGVATPPPSQRKTDAAEVEKIAESTAKR